MNDIQDATDSQRQRREGYRDATVLALDGDKWKPRKVYRQRRGGNGLGINTDGASYTLNTVDRHIVAILNFKH